MKALDLLLNALRALYPPGVEADARALFQHRIVVAAFCAGNALALFTMAALAYGFVGNHAFAFEADAQTIAGQVRADRGESAATAAFEARVSECDALDKGNDALAAVYRQRVFEKRRLAHTLNSYVAPLPECRRIGQGQ